MNAIVRSFTVERRDLSAKPGRMKPKPDAQAQIRDIVEAMTHLPRDCIRDPAELVLLMRRLGGRLSRIADSGFEPAPDRTSRPRLSVVPPTSRDAIAAVFGPTVKPARNGSAGTAKSRTGKLVKLETRGQLRLL